MLCSQSQFSTNLEKLKKKDENKFEKDKTLWTMEIKLNPPYFVRKEWKMCCVYNAWTNSMSERGKKAKMKRIFYPLSLFESFFTHSKNFKMKLIETCPHRSKEKRNIKYTAVEVEIQATRT